MVLCFSVLGLALAAMAFGAATRPERQQPMMNAQPGAAQGAQTRFFVDPTPGRVPIEALLLEIENHVRLEQAAAESFVEYPTSAMLHSKTVSPFVN